jgi:ubiquinone biosynthesis protein UbiJ
MTVTWEIGGFTGGVLIDEEGLPSLMTERIPGVHLVLPPDRLHVLAEGMGVIMREVRIEGNAGLAAELAYLAQNMRPDLAEFLAPHTGDVLAEFVQENIEALLRQAPRVGRTLGDAITDYAINEARLIVSKHELGKFMRDVDRTRDDVERLQARIERVRAGRVRT